jgi:hypothetical protein
VELLQADYEVRGDDCTVTVTWREWGASRKAVGLIAARDHADQIVEELAPGGELRTVVHRLDGDAVRFTAAYLVALKAVTGSSNGRFAIDAVDEKIDAVLVATELDRA